jgi:hypothetical protein
MIVAASTTLLADSRSGRRGGPLSWLLAGERQMGLHQLDAAWDD